MRALRSEFPRRSPSLKRPRLALPVNLSAVLCNACQPTDGFALARDDLSLPHQTDRHYAHGDDTEGDDNVLLSFRSREAQIASGPRHGVGLLVLGRCARGPTQNRRQTRYTRPHGPVGQVEGQSWQSVCVGYARGKYGKYAGFATNAAFQESNSMALVCRNRDHRETFLPPTSTLCSDAVEKTIPDIRVS